MIKGRFTFERTEQGQREQEALARQLAPMLEPGGRIKIKDDADRPYTYMYVELYTLDDVTEKKL